MAATENATSGQVEPKPATYLHCVLEYKVISLDVVTVSKLVSPSQASVDGELALPEV
jgi:hypothetical protein